MSGFPISAAIGALIGAFLGLLNYGVISTWVITPMERKAAGLTGPEAIKAQKRILLIRRVLLVLVVVIFAAIAALLGRSMVGRGI